MSQIIETIQASMQTYSPYHKNGIFRVGFVTDDDKPITIMVHTEDEGVAVVEAYLHLKNSNPGIQFRVKYVQYDPDQSGDIYEEEWISTASNYLLTKCLTEDNKVLVACFISLCNDCSKAEQMDDILRELLQEEISCNSVGGKLDLYQYTEERGAQLGLEDIKTRYSSIWKWFDFVDSVNFDFCEMQEFEELKASVTEPEELLYWTFVMCQYARCSCYYPYTLFLSIRDNAYPPYLHNDAYSSLRECVLGK